MFFPPLWNVRSVEAVIRDSEILLIILVFSADGKRAGPVRGCFPLFDIRLQSRYNK